MKSDAFGPAPLRGQVWFIDIPAIGEKPFVIVSNNRRNSRLSTVLGVRVTTAPKPSIPTIVAVPKEESVKGYVMCDDVTVLPKRRLKRASGALSRPAMTLIDDGLKEALALV